MNRTDEKVNQYLEGIYNTVIVKDIEERQARKEKDAGKRKITDIALLKTIARYLASVIGSPISMKSVTDYLISSGRKISPNTVSDYVEALTESFVFYPAERFDIVGKQLLKANKKLYMVIWDFAIIFFQENGMIWAFPLRILYISSFYGEAIRSILESLAQLKWTLSFRSKEY